MSVLLTDGERARLDALRQYQIMDTPTELAFDDITSLASILCGTPISFIGFIDDSRQWFKSCFGLTVTEIPRDTAFCTHAISQTSLFIVPDTFLDRRFADDLLVKSGVQFGEAPLRFYAGVPLVAPSGHVIGTLCVMDRIPRELSLDQQQGLQALARQIMVQLEMRRKLRDYKLADEHLRLLESTIENAHDVTIEGLIRALDLRDKETEGHSRRVAEMTVRLARIVGIPEEELVHIRRGALLHDIGKMGVPDDILLKPEPLTEAEWSVMQQHTTSAYAILSPIAFLHPALNIPYCHHEKWDGSGYPRGLKSETIPLAARLFTLVDVWDALCSDRPYRKGWPEEKVRAHIRTLAGTHFDPAIVEVFLEHVAHIATEIRDMDQTSCA